MKPLSAKQWVLQLKLNKVEVRMDEPILHSKLIIRRRVEVTKLRPERLKQPMIIGLIVIILTIMISRETGLSFSTLSEDAGMSDTKTWLTGALSTLGIILLAIAAGIMLFTSGFRKQLGISKRSSAGFWLSICTIVLMLDDAFQLHEILAGELFGMSDWIIQVAIGLMIILVLCLFRSAIQSSFIFALPAISFWAASVLLDLVSAEFSWSSVLMEDSFKLLGICCWLQFSIDIGNRSLRDIMDMTPSRYRGTTTKS
ncbi:MAG: hypothetical protein ACI9BO_001102 [Zhongshania sp.]|jgi:hypothetical protein